MKRVLSNPETKALFYGKRKIRRREDPAWFMFTEAKKRAKAKGLPFNLKRQDLVIPKLCPVFGVSLVTSSNGGQPFSPSLDAIVPSLGYVKGNIQVISNLANRMKSNASESQLRQFALWILERSNGDSQATLAPRQSTGTNPHQSAH